MKPKFKVGDYTKKIGRPLQKNIVNRIEGNNYHVTKITDRHGLPCNEGYIHNFDIYEKMFELDKVSIWNNQLKELLESLP